MTDFLGQNIDVGDFVVIKEPGANELAMGRVRKINSSTVGVYYIPNAVFRCLPEAEKQMVVDLLYSPEFENSEEITVHYNYTTREYKFRLYQTTRALETFVKVSKDQIKNFIERILSS